MVSIVQADVLDVSADALIYSTNVMLNCSGGVGSCLVQRYGATVQQEMHQQLTRSGKKFADQGEIFDFVPSGAPYRRVFHTCPCDGWYQTTPEIVSQVLTSCFRACEQDPDVQTIALSVLATGYGRFPFEDFFRVASAVCKNWSPGRPIKVAIAVEHGSRFEAANEVVKSEGLFQSEQGR